MARRVGCASAASAEMASPSDNELPVGTAVAWLATASMDFRIETSSIRNIDSTVF
jgi:hypothetical protein